MTDVFPSSPVTQESPQSANSMKFPNFPPTHTSVGSDSLKLEFQGSANAENVARFPAYTSPATHSANEHQPALEPLANSSNHSPPFDPHTNPKFLANSAVNVTNNQLGNSFAHPHFAEPPKSGHGAGSIQFPSFPPTSSAVNDANNSARWLPRQGSASLKASLHQNRRRSRAKSLSEQTQDAVKVVAPPISVTLVLLCFAWYLSSAVSNNLSKGILQIFPYPVTITMLQFVYAALFSFAAAYSARRSAQFANLFPRNTVSALGIVGPEAFVLRSTGPMAGFQIVGHILSLSATASIPVSLVHAIKSLSPMLTVCVYTFAFGIRYNRSTYVSLVPLTIGVIMACSAEFRARPLAILYAFLSCVVFVSQNIWSKSLLTTGHAANTLTSGKITNENSFVTNPTPRKLDKLTIIFWCAAMGFLGTLPIWLLSDLSLAYRHGFTFTSAGTAPQFWFLVSLNGFTHFCQNLLSFMILGNISPVSYSIASLLKRIFVMTAAIFWFGQSVSAVQGWGIVITFTGLYIYDRFGSKTQDAPVLPK